MSVKSIHPVNDVRHVTLKMSQKEINQFCTTGFVYKGNRIKQPRGMDVIFYSREKSNPNVGATFMVSHLNPTITERLTGEDIDKVLSYLPVVSDTIPNNEGIVRHPFLKVRTLLNNPELDYNKGELDFLRSKPVNPSVEWKSSTDIDTINKDFEEESRLTKEKIKFLEKKESDAKKHPLTGEKWYPFTIGTVTEGGTAEYHGARPDDGVGDKSTDQDIFDQKGKKLKRLFNGELIEDVTSS